MLARVVFGVPLGSGPVVAVAHRPQEFAADDAWTSPIWVEGEAH